MKLLQDIQSRLGETLSAARLLHWQRSTSRPTDYYWDCVRVFRSPLFPEALRVHRSYFLGEQRGFGENAFHVMWWMLFRAIRPERFLEIGVYRGQTLSLASLLQRMLKIDGAVTGVSPFSTATDSVSSYLQHVDYLEDTLANFSAFNLPKPELIKAYSTDAVATGRIGQQVWDAIYIDGNHDYEVAKADWEVCSANLRTGGIIILDDAALGTPYQPPEFAFAGHPGPSRLASEIDRSKFLEVLRVGHNRVFRKL